MKLRFFDRFGNQKYSINTSKKKKKVTMHPVLGSVIPVQVRNLDQILSSMTSQMVPVFFEFTGNLKNTIFGIVDII